MEALYYDYRGGNAPHPTMSCVLVGVLGSGNLEVLVEKRLNSPAALPWKS